MVFFLKFSAKPLGRLILVILVPFVLTIYKFYLLLKRGLLKFLKPNHHRFLSLLTHRHVIHVVIIIITLLTVTSNIQAYEIKEKGVSENSILSSLIGIEKEIVEEGLPTKDGTRVTSYLAEETMVTPEIISGQPQEEIEKVLVTTQGETALVKPEIPTTSYTPRKRQEVIIYLVQEGDTVSQIAEKFDLSSNTILWENSLGFRDYIQPGDELSILPESGLRHKIQKNETLSSIAKKYDVEEDEIIKANKLADANSLTIGENLMIPGGRKVYSSSERSTISRLKDVFIPPASKALVNGGMIWPTSGRYITQYFSWRHHGLDIDGDYSSPIYAAENGTVVLASWNGGYGISIDIDHGGGIKTRYGHLSKLLVNSGNYVEKGQTIGIMGSTGYSTGSHVHFEIMINGTKYNPLNYIQ